MKILSKKEVLTPRQKQLNSLKEDLRHCEMLINRTHRMFEMAVDETLIEARIYELKSLIKHHEYLMSAIRDLALQENDRGAITV
ncbi:MAG: hypothetical protein IKU54_01725 [Oscillospiraceae bacterium]|nr:hypothetical protein [Oscillospiraceae bacterium]